MTPAGEYTRAEYRAGTRLYLIVALGAGGLYVFTPEGPFRWLLLAITLVCLVRSMWYFARARSAPEDPPDEGGAPR